jgi:hypothetical protein
MASITSGEQPRRRVITRQDLEKGTVDLIASNLSGASLRGIHLSRANLTEANLAEADLTGANLAETDLTGANLTGACLNGAELTGANLTRACLNGAELTGADLKGANLSGASLSDAFLTFANFYGASLSGANLRRTLLRGANFAEVDLRQANLQDIEEDFYSILEASPSEVPGLMKALIEGKIDGNLYQGECTCLVGTLAKLRGVHYTHLPLIDPNFSRPAERWFHALVPGNRPSTSQIAKITSEWIEEWAALRGIALTDQVDSLD